MKLLLNGAKITLTEDGGCSKNCSFRFGRKCRLFEGEHIYFDTNLKRDLRSISCLEAEHEMRRDFSDKHYILWAWVENQILNMTALSLDAVKERFFIDHHVVPPIKYCYYCSLAQRLDRTHKRGCFVTSPWSADNGFLCPLGEAIGYCGREDSHFARLHKEMQKEPEDRDRDLCLKLAHEIKEVIVLPGSTWILGDYNED